MASIIPCTVDRYGVESKILPEWDTEEFDGLKRSTEIIKGEFHLHGTSAIGSHGRLLPSPMAHQHAVMAFTLVYAGYLWHKKIIYISY